jgi:RIO-like serine/threonine protein kinase
MINQQNNSKWPLKFIHGDLSSLNIIVRGDTIVGLIDWQTAG